MEQDHLSSLSRLPDQDENYTHIGFPLQPEERYILPELNLSNILPGRSISKFKFS